MVRNVKIQLWLWKKRRNIVCLHCLFVALVFLFFFLIFFELSSFFTLSVDAACAWCVVLPLWWVGWGCCSACRGIKIRILNSHIQCRKTREHKRGKMMIHNRERREKRRKILRLSSLALLRERHTVRASEKKKRKFSRVRFYSTLIDTFCHHRRLRCHVDFSPLLSTHKSRREFSSKGFSSTPHEENERWESFSTHKSR